MQPETRYARLGEDRLAYQVLGEGPDLVLTMGAFGHVDLMWEDPGIALFLRRLASFSRLILFDRRGTGASDPLPEPMPPPWEAYADEVTAVMDAVGVAAGRAHGHHRRGRPDGAVLRRHPAGADQRPGPRQRQRPLPGRRRLPDRVPARARRGASSPGSRTPGGPPARLADRHPQPGRRRAVPPLDGQDPALHRQPPDGPRLPAGHVRGGRPARCCRWSRRRRWCCTAATSRCSRSSTAATWPSTSPTPGWSSCPAPTAP